MSPQLPDYLKAAEQLLSAGYNPLFLLVGFLVSFISAYLISKNSILIAVIFSILVTLAIASFIVVYNLAQIEVVT